MNSNPEFGWAIPLVLLLLAFFMLRDPEHRQSLKEFMGRANKPILLNQMERRSKLILLTVGVLLVAGIFSTAGVFYARSLNSGAGPDKSATNTPVVTRHITGGSPGTQTGVSSPSAITVTSTSSGSAITLPDGTPTQYASPTQYTLPTRDTNSTPGAGWTFQYTATP